MYKRSYVHNNFFLHYLFYTTTKYIANAWFGLVCFTGFWWWWWCGRFENPNSSGSLVCARVDVRAPVQMLPAFALRYCPPVRRYGDSNVHVFIHIRIQINYVHNLHPMTHAWGVFFGGGVQELWTCSLSPLRSFCRIHLPRARARPDARHSSRRRSTTRGRW